MNAFAQALAGLRVISDAEDDARDRRERRSKLEATWQRVPHGAHRFATSPVFERAVDEWQPGMPMMLLGPTGSGKTAAVARLVARLCKQGVECGGEAFALARSTFWVRADLLIAAGGCTDRDESARWLVARAERCRLLVLDDVARTGQTLTNVLEERLDKRRVTLVTSGARNRGELATMLGGHAPLRWILEAGSLPGKVIAL